MTVTFAKTRLDGVYVAQHKAFADPRGTFCEGYNRKEFLAAGMDFEVDQVNVSRSVKRGTVRGMHWQGFPCAQKKLVRCVKGAAYDVIVDVRPNSHTYGQWVGVELFPEGWISVLIPGGFAHGWQALEDGSEIHYLTEGIWNKESEHGLSPVDPVVGISWPTAVIGVADRDLNWPAFKR